MQGWCYFGERRHAEVRRIHLLRGWVNRTASQERDGIPTSDAVPFRFSYSVQPVTVQLPRLVSSKNELSGSLRQPPKPPRPSWLPGPCSIPARLLPARKPAG